MKLRLAILASLPPAVLAACGEQAPSSQVLARVNGDDVTIRDLAAEGGSGGDAQGTLAQIVDRRLLVGIARERGLDRTPEYLAAMRRARELLLVQALGSQISASLPGPTGRQITEWLAAHPHAFAQRRLVRMKGAGSGTTTTVDTARLDPKDAQALAAVAPGGSWNRDGAIYEIVTSEPAPLPIAAAQEFARQSLAAEALAAAMQDQLAKSRKSSSILYKKDLGPPRS